MTYGRYSPVQLRYDAEISRFIVDGKPMIDHLATLAQHAGRSGDIEPYTLVSKIAATGKWQVFNNEAAGDGTAIPQGIYVGPTVAEADIQAGDVENFPVLLRDAHFREAWLVIENAKTLDTIITVGTTDLRVVRDHLMGLNLIPRDVAIRTDFET
jgi:hypothetical protein